MINFFAYSFSCRLLIVFILGICVLIQTLALVLTYYPSNFSRLSWFENLLELFILFQLIIFLLLFGQVVNGYKIGFALPSGYEDIRIAIFMMTLVLVIITSHFKRIVSSFIGLLAASISLPIFERILGNNYPWVFLLALLLLLGRSIEVCIRHNKQVKTNISALSVPHAINTMHTGILYSQADGQILLCNHQMQNLMVLLTGEIYRNAREFYEFLLSPQAKERFEKLDLEGHMVCLLPDKTAWMFTRTEISIDQKSYSHISASDVSKQWELTMKLQEQNQTLKDKSNNLKETISNLYALSREKEIEDAKIRAHDVLGQGLSLILRMIKDENNINYDLLSSLSKGLLEELKMEESPKDAMEEVKKIQDIFTEIGVEIDFQGDFPKEDKESLLLVDIIREATNNAVRHAFATKIHIKIDKKEKKYQLAISNNGYTPNKPIKAGSGIKEMRKKVAALGGQLEIRQKPSFTLSVTVPRGE